MKVTFLGTGTSHGVPVPGCECKVCLSDNPKDKRLRSSIYIESNGIHIIVDTGPDFRQQVLRESVKQIDAIIYTHEHQDHVSGLDDIRGFNTKYKKSIPIYVSKNVEKRLKQVYGYIFSSKKYPGIPDVEVIPIQNKKFKVKHLEITPIEVMHYKLPVLGFRINDFTYITDASSISDAEIDKVKGSKIIVLNALRKEKHISHFNLEESVEILDKLKPEKAYLIHMNHQMGLHDEVNTTLPDHINLAYDGLQINFDQSLV